MGHIIAMACHKGGVGKTTTAASLGGYLAMKGECVLLVDLDAQKNLTQTFVAEEDLAGEDTVFEALAGKCKRLPVHHVRENLDIVPSADSMCSVDLVFGGVTGKEFLLADLLDGVKGDYDWIIIDSPAQIGTSTANALVAADHAVIPMSCDCYSLGGLKQIYELIEPIRKRFNRGLDVSGILLTKFNHRRKVDQETERQLTKKYGSLMFETRIRECAAISKAPFAKMDICTFDRECNGSVDYMAFADELKKRIGCR